MKGKGSYIFKYEKDGVIIGYHMDTFCNYGPREYAKMYNDVYGEIKTQEIQNTVQWHAELGSKDLEGVIVIPEKIKHIEDIPTQYTIK